MTRFLGKSSEITETTMTWGPGFLPDANVDRALYQLDPALGGASSVDGFDCRSLEDMVKLHW